VPRTLWKLLGRRPQPLEPSSERRRSRPVTTAKTTGQTTASTCRRLRRSTSCSAWHANARWRGARRTSTTAAMLGGVGVAPDLGAEPSGPRRIS